MRLYSARYRIREPLNSGGMHIGACTWRPLLSASKRNQHSWPPRLVGSVLAVRTRLSACSTHTNTLYLVVIDAPAVPIQSGMPFLCLLCRSLLLSSEGLLLQTTVSAGRHDKKVLRSIKCACLGLSAVYTFARMHVPVQFTELHLTHIRQR